MNLAGAIRGFDFSVEGIVIDKGSSWSDDVLRLLLGSDLSIHAATADDLAAFLFLEWDDLDPLACFSFFSFLAGGAELSFSSSRLSLTASFCVEGVGA